MEIRWKPTLTLAERCRALTAQSFSLSSPREIPAAQTPAGQARWAAWEAQPPFDQDDGLARRLALDGIDLARFRQILDLPADQLPGDEPPPWAAELAAAQEAGCLLAERLLERLETRVEELCARHPHAPFEPAAAGAALQALVMAPEPWEDFPVLLRLAVEAAQTTEGHLGRVFEHLAVDAEALALLLADGGDLAPLAAVEVAPGQGVGARPDLQLTFDDGLQVIYRPRSLGLEALYQNLLAAFDGGEFGWHTLRVLDRSDHGWLEAPTPSPPQGRCSERLGAQLALLVGLGATELPAESLVFAGEQALLTDLGALLSAPLPGFDGGPGEGLERCGVWPLAEAAGIDREALQAGFTRAFRRLAAVGPGWLAPGGVLAAAASLRTRVHLRPPREYQRLLASSLRPDVLGDALDRDRVLDGLWRGTVERPWLQRGVTLERAALAQGELPVFTARLGGREVFGPGGELLPGLLAETPLAAVGRRLASFTETDLARHLAVLSP